MDYRGLYFDYTGSNIPNNYDIHHIDSDRENNHISNLVALPKELHTDLHKALYNLPEKYTTSDFQDVTFIQYFNQLKKYELVFNRVSLCIDFRNYLYLKLNGTPLAYTGRIPVWEEWNYNRLNYELYYLDDYENTQI